jgi:hypothetical protein
MTGWRVGYAAGPKEVIKGMSKLQSQLDTHAVSISQYATVEALNNSAEAVKKMREGFDERRKFVVDRIRKINGIKLLRQILSNKQPILTRNPQIDCFFDKLIHNTKAEDCLKDEKALYNKMSALFGWHLLIEAKK